MKDNEMIEYRSSFISKIRKFFKKLFGKNKGIDNDILSNSVSVDDKFTENRENVFLTDIKVNTDKINEKRDFFKKIDGNIEALNNLSVEKLEKIKKYYDNVIQQNNERINKLKVTMNID